MILRRGPKATFEGLFREDADRQPARRGWGMKPLQLQVPEVGQWYRVDRGEPFVVVAIEPDAPGAEGGVEIQYFDGTLEELGHLEWGVLGAQPVAAPEDCSGALDLGGQSDVGIGLIADDEGTWVDPLSIIERL